MPSIDDLEDYPSTSIVFADTDLIDIGFLSGGTRFATLAPSRVGGLTVWTSAEHVPFLPEGKLTLLDADPTSLLILPVDHVAIGLSDGSIVFAEASSSEVESLHRTERIHKMEVLSMCSLMSDKRKLASGSADGSIIVGDLETQTFDEIVRGECGAMAMCAISGGTTVCVGHMAGRLTLWDVREKIKNPVRNKATATVLLESNSDSVTALAAHPSQANVFAFGTESGSIGFVDVRAGGRAEVMNGLSAATQAITKICFHPSLAENLFAASADGSLQHLDASRSHAYTFGAITESPLRQVSWCLPSLQESLTSTSLYPRSSKYPQSFDICSNSLVVAFANQMIHCLDGIKLS
ncbi:unnamed protein product, partial [Mesorhabditis belari]|uniref:Uncharacterized protein n=1 Tax=Mesorhabditis belari TaxID=2138241 RepID=A0AAF3FH99_9BILA